MSRWYLLICEIVFVGVVAVAAVLLFRRHPPAPDAVAVDIKLPDARSHAWLQRQPDGGLLYLISNPDGAIERLPSEQLAERLYKSASSGSSLWFLNFSAPTIMIWIGIGLLGQLLFTGRMLVQWIASERQGKSVVPPLFWWMSLVGSLLLLAYFLWRRDPIGLLGQAFGSFVYLKNIVWILADARQQPPALAAA
jgi:lipid-A-disaccharide synthase-like uncharacterized protein